MTLIGRKPPTQERQFSGVMTVMGGSSLVPRPIPAARGSARAMVGIAAVFCMVVVGLVGAPPVAAAVEPCYEAGELDINGDGYADAVVGDPDATVSGQAQAGRIVVLYGDADGRLGEGGRVVVTQTTIGQTPEAGDRFGAAVATAHVDADACLDVVVGVPGEDLAGHADAGMGHVIYGSLAGLNGDAAPTHVTQATAGGTVEAGDQFGRSVAAGDNLGRDTSVVAFGAPYEDIGAAVNTGAVNALQFSDSILVTPVELSQSTPGVVGTSESGDLFGFSLAYGFNLINDYDTWNLVVGAPGEDIGTLNSAGAVTVIDGVQDFPPAVFPSQSWNQDSPGVPGAAEAGDQFGYSVATSVIDSYISGSRQHVAVGAPGEAIGTRTNAGAVQLFSSTGGGLQPGVSINQDTAGVLGAAETGDRFGFQVALLNAPKLRLAVGVPYEDLGTIKDAGSVQVFTVSSPADDQAYDADSAGAAGARTTGGRYGLALSAIQADNENVFAVGSPYQGTGRVHLITYNTAGYASRSWVPGSGGVPGSAARFGASIGGFDASP